jgi:hypothetical protein
MSSILPLMSRLRASGNPSHRQRAGGFCRIRGHFAVKLLAQPILALFRVDSDG